MFEVHFVQILKFIQRMHVLFTFSLVNIHYVGKQSYLICLHTMRDDDHDALTHRSRCIELHSYKQLIEKVIQSGS